MVSWTDKRVMKRLVAVACTALWLCGCTVKDQAPGVLTGPSGFGRELRMTATPDSLPRDGSSQSRIDVTYTDYDNKPLTNRRLVLTTTGGTLSVPEVRTDGSGAAAFVLIAPGANTPLNSVWITATPVANEEDKADGANVVSQSIAILLQGPTVVASFTAVPNPAVGVTTTFDASGTTVDGVACGAACTYTWDFGDGTSGSGQLVQHTYQVAGVMTVTLSVSAPGGGVGSAVKSYSLVAAAPVASFTITPASPTAGSAAVFDGSASTVGAGATIVQYAWDFGDGQTDTRSTPFSNNTYAAAGLYVAKLTITDSLGRTAIKSVTVTVN